MMNATPQQEQETAKLTPQQREQIIQYSRQLVSQGFRQHAWGYLAMLITPDAHPTYLLSLGDELGHMQFFGLQAKAYQLVTDAVMESQNPQLLIHLAEKLLPRPDMRYNGQRCLAQLLDRLCDPRFVMFAAELAAAHGLKPLPYYERVLALATDEEAVQWVITRAGKEHPALAQKASDRLFEFRLQGSLWDGVKELFRGLFAKVETPTSLPATSRPVAPKPAPKGPPKGDAKAMTLGGAKGKSKSEAATQTPSSSSSKRPKGSIAMVS